MGRSGSRTSSDRGPSQAVSPPRGRDFWLDTGFACGLVRADATGRIVRGGAPIFARFVGQDLARVVAAGRYRVEPLST